MSEMQGFQEDSPKSSKCLTSKPATSQCTNALAAVQPLIRVPSSAQRRMEQCLSLARELLTAQNRADGLDQRREQLEAECERLSAQLADAQRLVSSRCLASISTTQRELKAFIHGACPSFVSLVYLSNCEFTQMRMTGQPQSYLVEQVHLAEQKQRAAEAQLAAVSQDRRQQEVVFPTR